MPTTDFTPTLILSRQGGGEVFIGFQPTNIRTPRLAGEGCSVSRLGVRRRLNLTFNVKRLYLDVIVDGGDGIVVHLVLGANW